MNEISNSLFTPLKIYGDFSEFFIIKVLLHKIIEPQEEESTKGGHWHCCWIVGQLSKK
jgi:hypothetical protein